jgi:trimeric autotransporter adhesin
MELMTKSAAALAAVFTLASPAVADQLCIKATGATRSIRIRAAGCKPTEIALGSFDGTTLQLSGINLQVVSGTGATDGAVNGRGNLIVGYNEDDGRDRTGSHNLVLGRNNGYSGFGGIVSGDENQIANQGSVIASFDSEATDGGVVVGGFTNSASIGASAVFGGQNNIARGVGSTVVGGASNTANGVAANVTGGTCNAAGNLPADPECTASCGFAVCGATVSGGSGNSAVADHATVSGGLERSATGTDDWVAGPLFTDN